MNAKEILSILEPYAQKIYDSLSQEEIDVNILSCILMHLMHKHSFTEFPVPLHLSIKVKDNICELDLVGEKDVETRLFDKKTFIDILQTSIISFLSYLAIFRIELSGEEILELLTKYHLTYSTTSNSIVFYLTELTQEFVDAKNDLPDDVKSKLYTVKSNASENREV